jgi:heat shock protein HslJ
MRLHHVLIGGVLALSACANEAAPTTPATATRNTAELLNTYWKLVQLGDQVVNTPAGAREIHFVLQSVNQGVTGFSGCNRMMGSYVLDGARIRFEQMAGTLMACVPDLELERQFLAMFALVARWEISGESLRLLDSQGKSLAAFEARSN